ncbi:MAG TPA: hypothetical protein DCF68_14675 [Cyanothece sp. UBA12306]|nr:hypothetical protein [Cyanothece sp. UBA12306]
MSLAKKIVKKTLKKMGYEIYPSKNSLVNNITKKVEPDLTIYQEIYGQEFLNNKKFYNIGAGNWRHPAWTNIDNFSDWYQKNPIDISFDLSSNTSLPIEDDSTELIYSSHTLEHINNESAFNILKEAYRILKKGGAIRIAVPNIELAYRAFKKQDKHYFYWFPHPFIKLSVEEISIGQMLVNHFATHTAKTFLSDQRVASTDATQVQQFSDEEINQIFARMPLNEALDRCTSQCSLSLQKKYPYCHINWWSYAKLSDMLHQLGFKNIYQSGFGQSAFSVLRDTQFFDNSHSKISLYVEAVK